MTKTQKIAMLKKVIEIGDHKSHGLEDWVTHYFDRYVRQCRARGEAPSIEAFFEQVPQEYRVVKSQAKNFWSDFLDSFRVELLKLEAENKLVQVIPDLDPDPTPLTLPAPQPPPPRPKKKKKGR